ncbi:MAG: diaminopimelate decarboxylase [Cytophagales bacterium]|nr:diaminopimelate decarboxylase [Cytophagales bacterium]MDW8384588.1 diaminopimelate decarboxylase [Flammeovirgaceae bacterium]
MEYQNGKYTLQGISLEEIAQEFGTPLYIYDGNKIISQYHRLHQAFSGVSIKLKYACKANTNISIIKLLKQQGAGLDAVSIQEARIGLMAGYSPSQIMFTPNCVDFSEMEEAIELGLVLNLDSLPALEYFGKKYGNRVPICLRIRPGITAGGNSNIQVGHNRSKFGLPLDQLPQAKEIIQRYQLNVVGLHKHSGSDIKETDAFVRGANLLFDLAIGFPNLTFIDLGSGFKVAYKAGDIVTNIEELGAKVSITFQEFCRKYGKNLELWFEPGKFLVSEAGYFLVTVSLVKETTETTFVGVHSGFNHLIRPMFYHAHHDIINISNPEGEKKTYDVVGYICETDTFSRDCSLSEVRRGDILCFKNAGAYGYSMASNYNSRPRPAEVLVLNGNIYLIRQREGLQDLMQHQIDIFQSISVCKNSA